MAVNADYSSLVGQRLPTASGYPAGCACRHYIGLRGNTTVLRFTLNQHSPQSQQSREGNGAPLPVNNLFTPSCDAQSPAHATIVLIPMSPDSALAASLAHVSAKKRGVWAVVEILERVGAFLLLIVLSPLLILVAATVVLLSRRSPLVAHLRVGQYESPLWTLKFRTMWTNPKPGLHSASLVEYIVDESGMDYKSTYDPRVTSNFARFCRRFSIDELPQLSNVVRGEMSLVGPRPLTDGELKKHYGFDAPSILLEKPGITGLWQVRGRSRLTYEERRRMDLFLVRNRSLRLYFTILLRTTLVVWKGEDGW